jgi:hypothetical protein
MYESIPNTIIPPPRKLTFQINTVKFATVRAKPIVKFLTMRAKNIVANPHISASYLSHIILREENQLDFKCLFNIMIGSKHLVLLFI